MFVQISNCRHSRISEAFLSRWATECVGSTIAHIKAINSSAKEIAFNAAMSRDGLRVTFALG